MLIEPKKIELLDRIRPVLAEHWCRERVEIDRQNAEAVAKDGKPRFTAGKLATMSGWPTRAEPTPYSGGSDLEFIRDPDGELYSFRKDRYVLYPDHRAGWKALPEELKIIREVMGLSSDDEAHALLPELHHELRNGRDGIEAGFSYGVLVLPLFYLAFENWTAVGIRSKEVGSNQGTLSLLGGFVHPGETVFQAGMRQLRQEAGMQVKSRGWAAWGPHNGAQSATFVVPASVVKEAQSPARDAWELEGKTYVLATVKELHGFLTSTHTAWKQAYERRLLDRFASAGLARSSLIAAPDMVGPAIQVLSRLVG